MRMITMFLVLCLLSGCTTQSEFQKRRKALVQDIVILKLEVRKEHLENELETLERE